MQVLNISPNSPNYYQNAVDTAADTVGEYANVFLSAFDAGADVYMGLMSRIYSLNKLNADLKKDASAPVVVGQPSVTDKVVGFLKSESGLLVIGAVAVLGFGMILSRGK